MHLTPEMLVRSYEYLCATPPFNKWKLPDSDDVAFRVARLKSCYGMHEVGYFDNDPKKKLISRISISTYNTKTTHMLIETMAHEICHMHQGLTDTKRDSVEHGPKFKRLAAQVCKAHGFDLKTF